MLLASGGWRGASALPDNLPAGWREHARRQHLALIHRWVGAPSGRWLKTDVFEELEAPRALIPSLTTAHWVGMDISRQIGGLARASVVADVRQLPFPDRAFDGVLSTSTLDHFDDRLELFQALCELHRTLRPGSRLVLTLDNPQNPLVRLRNAIPFRVATRTGLVPFPLGVTLSEKEGREALAEAGFLVEQTEFLLHTPFIVGTRLARFDWYARRLLPIFDRLGSVALGRWTGHFVAFLAAVPGGQDH